MGDPPEPAPAKDPEPSPELLAIKKLGDEIDDLRNKLDTVLEVLLYTSEPERISIVSRIRKKFRSGRLLASIRKANES